jgi:hypothetical protein
LSAHTNRLGQAVCALAVLLSAACMPSAFDELAGKKPAHDAAAPVPDGASGDGGRAHDGGDAPHDAQVGSDAQVGRDAQASEGGVEPPRCASPLPMAGLPYVDDAQEIGVLPVPDSVTVRRGGASTLVGDQLLWLFSETRPKASTDFYATAVLGSTVDDPSASTLMPVLDDATQPTALIGDGSFVVPGGAIAREASATLLFYSTFYFISAVEAWVTELPRGAVSAPKPAAPLFKLDEGGQGADKNPWGPLFFNGPFLHDGFVYVYACNPKDVEQFDKPCRLARVPLADALDLSAYRYYSGRADAPWSSDKKDAAPAISGVFGDLTVAYNAHAKGFIAVFTSYACDGQIELHFAKRPEGPWQRFGQLETAPLESAAQGTQNYRALHHPALESPKGDELVLSYLHYLEADLVDGTKSKVETRLMRVKLR